MLSRFAMVLACCNTAIWAAETEADRRLFQLQDVFELEHASDPQVSPDGKHVVYVRNAMDIMTDRAISTLWVAATDGKAHRPLTTGSRHDQSPRWSPDGTRIAYVGKDGDRSHVFCRWIASGETARMTGNLTETPMDLAWSPDGEWLAFSMLVENKPKPFVDLPAKPKGATWAEPFTVIRNMRYRADGSGYLKDGFRHLFVIPADGGTPRQVTTGDFHHAGHFAWSHDGESLIVSANREKEWARQPRESDLFEVSLKDGAYRQLTDRNGPDESPAVSPDGKLIAWVGFEDRYLGYQVALLSVMNRDGSNKRVLNTTFDRSFESPVWSDDSQGVYVQYDDQGVTHVGYLNLEGQVQKVASHVGGVTLGRPYSSGSFSMQAGTVAYTSGTVLRPADVSVTRSGGKPRQLTELNDDLFGHKTLGKVEDFYFESSVAARKIHAWLVYPPNFDSKKKYPLILEIHGGPFANYGSRFSTEVQLYAAAGYVVLYVNPQGSTSYGEDFANLIHHKYPADDYHDLMSAVDVVIKRGFVDSKNLFVTGGSGGGILTAWIVGKTNRFRAAVSAKPVINWYSFALTSDGYPYFSKYWFPAQPWDKPEEYLKRSPISLVGNVKTPTMLMTGEEDYRTPISESEQFYAALQLRNIDTALVRVPGASHGIVARPSRLMVKVAHILKWFEMYRLP
ncbi:MAG: S9 family peptidase [Planctomycetota bacterium]|nr:S9 family peptidase [Planctomycetota bacterium]